MMRALVIAAVSLSLWLIAGTAAAGSRASFALVIGSNVSVDAELAPLHYADDDAAQYFDLFRLMGMRTALLTRLDENTRKLHPQAAAEAQVPRRAELDRAVSALAAEVAEAKKRGLDTVLYVVFAGHGGLEGGRGYIGLEDARLTGDDLGAEVVARIPASAVHVILDACNSYRVAYARGPGGARRPVRDFARSVYELGSDPRVGLLLSTSSANESHEWDTYQSGVFSHEVRSGLYGAADADGDGEVSYREIAAFVARANESIENERFRPRLYARAPTGDPRGMLLDMHAARGPRVTIDGKHAGRYLLEDARGVRLADFHSAPGQAVELLRPAPSERMYLRTVDGELEYALLPGPESVALADVTGASPRVLARGALHDSFSRLFLLPFDRSAVAGYAFATPPEDTAAPADEATPAPGAARTRTIVGVGLVAAGAVGLGIGTYFGAVALSQPSPSASDSQADVAQRNDRVSSANRGAAIGLIAGGALAASGLVVLLWPSAPRGVTVSVAPGAAFAGYGASF